MAEPQQAYLGKFSKWNLSFLIKREIFLPLYSDLKLKRTTTKKKEKKNKNVLGFGISIN